MRLFLDNFGDDFIFRLRLMPCSASRDTPHLLIGKTPYLWAFIFLDKFELLWIESNLIKVDPTKSNRIQSSF